MNAFVRLIAVVVGVVSVLWTCPGSAAVYHFRGLQYSQTSASVTAHVAWQYDPHGRKILKTDYVGTPAETRYVYDGPQLIQEIDASNGDVLAEYTYGPGYVDDVVRVTSGANTYYLHGDQQYSTIAATDASGNVAERYTYDAFGAPTFHDPSGTQISATTINNATLYTGRAWDPALGLYDYRNRMYNPAIGRFTMPDLIYDHINLGNPYSYLGNNPGADVDPYGQESGQVEDISALSPRAQEWYRNRQRRNADAGLVRSKTAADAEHDLFGSDLLDPNGDTPDYSRAYGRMIQGKNEALDAAKTSVELGTLPLTGPAQIIAGSMFVTAEAGKEHPSYVGIGITVLGLGAVTHQAFNASRLADIDALGSAWSRAKATDPLGIVAEMRGQKGFAFDSFSAFKNFWGSPGPDRVWHHIVEQSKEGQFGTELVHNVYNLVTVPAWVNKNINRFYSSIRPQITGSNSQTVRAWLRGQSYEKQREFGLWALNKVSGGELP